MQAEQTVQGAAAVPPASDYPKRPSTCEVVDGPEGQPGTQVRCAHCGVPFKTTAWNWARKNFIARKCQDAIRAAKAEAGVTVQRKPRREPAAVTLGTAAVTAQLPTPAPEGPDMVWASPECGRDRLRVFTSDMAETFPEQPTGTVVYDFGDSAEAREGRAIGECAVCSYRCEVGAAPEGWPGSTVYLHVAAEVPDTRRRARPGARRSLMQTWCVVTADGRALRFVAGRLQDADEPARQADAG